MAKISKHFTVTKKLPKSLGSIEFSGIVYNDDPQQYDIEDVVFNTPTHQENITSFFMAFRQLSDPEFHHNDIVDLLEEWLGEEKSGFLTDEEFKNLFVDLKNKAA